MNKVLSSNQRNELNRKYFMKLIRQIKPIAYVLNIKLANNPFLKNEDKFQFILYQLNEYNKRVQKQQVTDPYQMASYQKLYSMISDISQIDSKKDQLQILSEINDWFKQQNRLIQQRRNQGQIRYQMNNNYRKYIQIDLDQKPNKINQEENLGLELPNQYIDRIMEPYRWGNRTSHKQLDIPLRRLNQYKRKVINIAPFIENKELVRPPRVLYPMPPKYQPKQEQEEPKQGEQSKQNKQGTALIEGQQSAVQQGEENKQGGELQGQQSMGILGGGEDDEPQEEPVEVQDKLAPRNKLYVSEIPKPTNDKYYKGQYMQYRGQQNASERSLEQRYLKLQEQILVKQRQDRINIDLANERARKKSKIVKQIQKKLEDMIHKPKYIFSEQESLPQQKLSKQDEIRFGFTMNVRPKPKYNEIDLTNNTSLPRINDNTFDEKTIRRDRIKSLKSKFSKLLNLSEYQEREVSASMCQYTSRKRGFSEIIKHHSKSKQRLNQLDEVTRIKQKLTRNKIGVNIRALSQGLCLPEAEQNSSPTPQNIFPNKQLPSNPFMVETKKKKKKK